MSTTLPPPLIAAYQATHYQVFVAGERITVTNWQKILDNFNDRFSVPNMKKSTGFFYGFIALVLGLLISNAYASDINCEKSNLVKSEELICEYTILRIQYESIYKKQIHLLSLDAISTDTINVWKRKRDECESVKCLDEVFSEWEKLEEIARKAASADISKTDSFKEKSPQLASYGRDHEVETAIENKRVPAEANVDRSEGGESGSRLYVWLIIVVAILGFFFKKKNPSSAKQETKVEVKWTEFIRTTQNCARCDYWSGERKVVSISYVAVPSQKLGGKCHVVAGHASPANANFRCIKFRRWGALKE